MIRVWRLSGLVVGLTLLAGCGAAKSHVGSTPTSPPSTPPSSVPVAACGHFATSVTTDHTRYRRGQAVVVTATRTNDGPGCRGSVSTTCGGGAYATDQQGQVVWNSAAGPHAPVPAFSCPVEPSPPPTTIFPSRASQSAVFQWGQDHCTFETSTSAQLSGPNSECPGTQVPDGVYSIGVTGIYGATGRVFITIIG